MPLPSRRHFLAAPALLATRRDQPNVLWLMTDEQRPDSLGCYRSGWAHTPHLDAVAAQGTLFESAYVPSPVCVPSRSALITGRTASSCGVLHNRARLGPGSAALTWRFEDAGYQTATFGKKHFQIPGPRPAFQTEGGMITDEFVEPENYGKGIDPAGFDVLQYVPPPERKEKRSWILGGRFPVDEDRSAEARNVALAVDWLDRRRPDRPFFLRLSLNAPHTPAVAPGRYLPLIDPARIRLPFPAAEELAGQPRREAVALRAFQGTQSLTREQLVKARHYYYARAAFADAMIGRLLDTMRRRGLLDNTIVAFVSDHGSHLGDHGMVQKQTFYEQVATVPFFFWSRGQRAARMRTPVSTLSLMPTLLDLAGLPHDGVQAPSLARSIRTAAEPAATPVFSEIAFGYQGYRDAERQVMVRDGRWKLSLFPDGGDPDPALYDLAADPGEAHNLAAQAQHQPTLARLRGEITAWSTSAARASSPGRG